MADIYREHGIEGKPYARSELLDPPLTSVGREQAAALCAEARTLSPTLVVVSPLARATKTALLAFDHLVGRVPFVAHELCREISGVNSCDARRSASEAKKELPFTPSLTVVHLLITVVHPLLTLVHPLLR